MNIRRAVFLFLILAAAVTVILGTTGRAINAQTSGSSNTELLAKLGEILNNQRSIIGDLASIKEELRIIKIRITQSQ